ncbi:4-coumarate--CoA ligase 3-like [Lucilia cuprina]|uniref:4-coumarate--CoA ligase 3-like n=1 Tax=Lucilia cuprina TaxID=7375 RepID=UPI001F06783F|nr:4-coumarate--CoA ligase 3-like [Lucilia cuprina]
MDFAKVSFDKRKKIWTTPSTQGVYNTECALGRIIYNQLNSFPNVTLQIDDSTGVTVKARDALTNAVRIAQHFNEMKLHQDDIIGFAVKNTTNVLPTVIGCFFNCTPFHAVNPVLDESTLSHCFGLTKPKLIFCDAEVYKKVYLATKAYKPKIITMSGDVEGVVKITDLLEPTKTERFYQPKHYSIGGHQTVAILCSSGTTGKPKAVCLAGFNLIHELPYVTSETVLYVPSAIDWITGLAFMVASCFTGCTRIICDKPFNADDFIRLMKKYKITNAFLAPRYIAALVNHPEATKEVFASLQMVQSGGSTVTEKLLKSFKALLNEYCIVIFGYGLTEFGAIAGNIDISRITSVGQLAPNISMRIVDDDGNNLGHNEIGEVCVYNGKYWGGYYGNPIETQRMRDAHGWYHTGDLGYMDDDNYLYVVDRKKEIRKYLGLHFWPKEIEEAIVEMPGVKDACVVTVSDETKGDCSGALVVKAPNSKITEQDVIDYVKNRLVDIHKQIHAGVFFVDSIPQNSNGKMVRIEGKKIFESLLERNLVC